MSVKNSIDKLKREVMYKTFINLDGNVNDLIYHKRINRTLTDTIKLEMEETEVFENIVLWDRVSGITNGDLNKINAYGEKNNEIDEDDDFASLDETLTGGEVKNPCEMFDLIMNTLKNDTKTLFILNYSDFIFSQEQAMQDTDRLSLNMLIKAIEEREIEVGEKSLGSSVIFITKNSSIIPSSIFQNNPDFSRITISKPDRVERIEFIEKNEDNFDLDKKSDEELEETTILELVAHTEGMTYKEIMQLWTLSRSIPRSSINKLVNLYKFGKYNSKWETFSKGDIDKLKKSLNKRVKGQDHAKDKIVDLVVRAISGLSGLQHSSNKSKPKGSLFFSGPTGVGKTELAKSLAEFLFGNESACIRFDMSEYSQEHSDQKLIGAPPGYVGFEAGGILTNKIKENPFCVVLFDEIEKAHPRILDKFLQILEDGRLTDNKGETVFFSECVIIFTSNIGNQEANIKMSDEESSKIFVKAVKEKFNEINRPELLGRIGEKNVIPFNFIKDKDIQRQIADIKLKPITKYLEEEKKFYVEYENKSEILNLIVESTNFNYGARDIGNKIEDIIVNKLSYFIVDNDLARGSKIIITRKGNNVEITSD